MNLKNSTILITGGSSGIGLELVKQIGEFNQKIIITGRNSKSLAEVKKMYPFVETFVSDVSNTSQIESLAKEIVSKHPDLNVIVNNAGIMRNLNMKSNKLSIDNITDELDTNLVGAIKMIHTFLPHLLSKSDAGIVNITSSLAFVPYSAAPVYSASKAGLHAFTKALRLQLLNTNISVIEVAPPSTETPLQNEFRSIIDAKMNMSVEKMVSQTLKGIMAGKTEIKPGMSKIIKLMSRIAPHFIINYLHKSTLK
jgi:uncharacterized oxidoreductase